MESAVGLITFRNRTIRMTPEQVKARIISQRSIRLAYQCTFLSHETFVFEAEPAIRTIRVREKTGEFCGYPTYTSYTLVLAFPYVQYCLVRTLTDSRYYDIPHITWSKEPVTKDSLVQPLFLPNVYSNGGVCMPWYNATCNSPRTRAEEFVDLFWSSKFTPHEYNWPYRHLLFYAGIKSLEDWQKKTLEHGSPNFMLDLMPLAEEYYPPVIFDVVRGRPQ